MSAGRINNSVTKDWNTPPKYIIPIKEFFYNSIELDPCSNQYSIVNAQKEIKLPENGLEIDWDYVSIFVNPPYGRNFDKTTIYDWLNKGLIEHQKYKNEIIFLIPVATNTKHFKNLIFRNYSAICFLGDTRLKFYNKGVEDKKGAPMACCLVYLGVRVKDFISKFSVFGKVLEI